MSFNSLLLRGHILAGDCHHSHSSQIHRRLSRSSNSTRAFANSRSFQQPGRRSCFASRRRSLGLASRARTLTVQARAEDLSVQDRVCGALPYLIPLLDGLRYGRFFFVQFPAAASILGPLQPLVSLYYGFPLASLIVFFGIYSGVANNSSFSRHIRVNAMQALLLSIVLIFPSLFEQVFRGALAPSFRVSLYNTIWIFVATCVTYGSGASLLGSIARLPLVSDAANQRIM